MMKFDGNQAWKQATSSVAANRDLLLALAGVFFLLPPLAFGLFVPQPEPAPGASEVQILALARAYYMSAFPFMLLTALVQAIGTLAALTLFTDKTRPTVGEAIKTGLGAMPIYLLAQLLPGIGLGVIGGFALSLGSLTGSQALTALLILAVVVGAIYVGIKTSLVAPIIAVERQRNPLTAIKRSWRLTRGNSVRMGLFYLLLGIAALLLGAIATGGIGIVLALTLDVATSRVIATVCSSAISAVMTVYLVAALAAIHRQLAGSSPEVIGEPFA